MYNAKSYIFLVFILLFSYSISFADNISNKVDSLYNIYSNKYEKGDINTANEIFQTLYDDQFADSIYVFTENTPLDSINMLVFELGGSYYFHKSNYNLAIKYANISVEFSKKLNNNWQLFNNYSALSCAYQRIGNYDKALLVLISSLKLATDTDNNEDLSIVLNNFASLFLFMHKDSMAIEFLKKAIIIERKIGGGARLATRLSNLGEAYLKAHKPLKALPILIEALDIDMKAKRIDKI